MYLFIYLFIPLFIHLFIYLFIYLMFDNVTFLVPVAGTNPTATLTRQIPTQLILIPTFWLADFSSSWMFSNAGQLNRTDGHRVKLFEESVTFIAQLQNDVRAIIIIILILL